MIRLMNLAGGCNQCANANDILVKMDNFDLTFCTASPFVKN